MGFSAKAIVVLVVAGLGLSAYAFFWVLGDIYPNYGTALRVFPIVIVAVVIAIELLAHFGLLRWLLRINPDRIEPQPLLYNESLTIETAKELIGHEGVVHAALRPQGNVLIEGTSYVVRSEGEFVEEGTRIRVVRLHDYNIVVVPVEEV